jgi:hypothetical protein
MLKGKRLGQIVLGILISVSLIALLWWRYSVDEKLGYCGTPQETCVNRENIPVGEPCACHGTGGGVFGLDYTGKVVPSR